MATAEQAIGPLSPFSKTVNIPKSSPPGETLALAAVEGEEDRVEGEAEDVALGDGVLEAPLELGDVVAVPQPASTARSKAAGANRRVIPVRRLGGPIRSGLPAAAGVTCTG
ncbi:MAG: hypothetical protein V9G19_08540 [Tetrasphaera sp.]